ncbi:MAG: hypothetical protein A4E52_00102 [Pelotomaculum sp. PtaB.Bin013]|nr:MAG: hypothetical protein A4E52_00102 [Pelotomaculum sp. PtaB.Bin013]
MKVYQIGWTKDRINHIARHKIEPYEVEQVAFEDPHRLIMKVHVSYSDSNKFIYRLLGRTEGGRYLAFFFIPQGRGTVYPVTAREMDAAERRLYNANRR